jgi:hypothetical protein
MARTGIVFGLILCGITFVGLVGIPVKTPTQFYAMMLGIPILICGVVALNPHRRRSAMACAAAIALLGASAGAIWSTVQLFAMAGTVTETDRYSLRLIALMTAVCLLFIAFCVIGFRKLKRRSERRPPTPPPVRLPSHSDKISAESDASSREIA